DRQAAQAAEILRRLDAIPGASLPSSEQANRAILKLQLEDAVEANRFGQRQLLYSTLGSYHEFLAEMTETMPFPAAADYENYLARLELVPERMRSYGEISLKAAREGYVQPCVTMGGFASTITANITPDVANSRFFAPFAAERPEYLAASDWGELQS